MTVMRKRRGFVIVFLIFFLLSLILLGIFGSRNGRSSVGIFELVTSPIQEFFVNMSGVTRMVGENEEIANLKKENIDLTIKEAEIKKIEREISALRDQYQSSKIASQKLLPAQIVGRRGFVPGVSVPESIVINKGSAEGLKKGQVIIYKDMVLGKISKTSTHLSEVVLIWHPSSSLTALTLNTNSNGILRGVGNGDMRLENVLLSEKLNEGDVVVTKGDMDSSGVGFPPDLVLGKIRSVDKKQSALFQTAEVTTSIDISKISGVFVITGSL